MSLTAKQKQLIIKIDHRVNQLLSQGGQDEELLLSLSDIMSDLTPIIAGSIDASTKDELDMYCRQYAGFYRFMQLLENLARGLSNGTMSVPSSE